MERKIKQIIAFLVGMTLFLLLVGIAGKYERSDEIVHGMPEEVYDAVIEKIGNGASNIEVAEAYMNDKTAFDSVIY